MNGALLRLRTLSRQLDRRCPSLQSPTSLKFVAPASSSLLCWRGHASLARNVPSTSGGTSARHEQRDANDNKSTKGVTAPAGGDIEKVPLSRKEQRHRDVKIIKQLLPNIWPKGDNSTKTRVVLAVGLLIAGKVSLLLSSVRNGVDLSESV